MDWTKAIEINREALSRIVAGLVALLAAQGGAARLALPVYHLIARVLYPAESAVRRLILIAARGLVVPPSLARPMPKGMVIQGKGAGRVAFQLFDTRKHFSDAEDVVTGAFCGPRIRVVGDADPRSLFLAKFKDNAVADGLCSAAETLRVSNRLNVLKRALDTLPQQARRMVRWLQRRAAMKDPAFIHPLRPGPPPGRRKNSRDEIDSVLRECHALAWQAHSNDTS